MDYLYELYELGFKVARCQWKHETVMIHKETNRPAGVFSLNVHRRVDSELDLEDLALEYGDIVDAGLSVLRLREKFKNEALPIEGELMWANINYVYIDKEYRGRNLGALFIKASCEILGGSCMITSIAEDENPALHAYWIKQGFEELPDTRETKHCAPSIFRYEQSFYEANQDGIECLKGRCIHERVERRASEIDAFDRMFDTHWLEY